MKNKIILTAIVLVLLAILYLVFFPSSPTEDKIRVKPDAAKRILYILKEDTALINGASTPIVVLGTEDNEIMFIVPKFRKQ